MPPAALASRARSYVVWAALVSPRALFEQLRHPVAEVGWLRRIGFAIVGTVWIPLWFLYYVFVVPRRLVARQAIRA